MEPSPRRGAPADLGRRPAPSARYEESGELGDGWLGSQVSDATGARRDIATIRRFARPRARSRRDRPAELVGPPPKEPRASASTAEHDRVVAA